MMDMRASEIEPAWEVANHHFKKAIEACQEELDRKFADVFAPIFEEFGIVYDKDKT